MSFCYAETRESNRLPRLCATHKVVGFPGLAQGSPCTALAEIHYAGTKEQWAAVEKGKDWNEGVPSTEVLVRK